MIDQRELNMKKAMAWERAKGELRSISHCFYSDHKDTIEQFKQWDKKVEEFISEIEDNGIGGFT